MGNGPTDLGTHGVVESFLRRARQRHLLQLGMDAGTHAATAAFLGAILLLLAGTQILNWWWPGVLFLVGFCVAAWRLRGKVATPYIVAQRVDRRLELHDTVSSAFYFRNLSESRPVNLETIEQQAERGLAGAELRRAMPLQTPAGAIVLAGAVLMAASLFGIRYGLMGKLDLSAPIADLSFDIFPSPQKAQASTKKSAVQENFEKQLEQFGLSLEELDTKVNNSEATTDQTAGAEGSPDGNVPMQTNQKGGEASDKKGDSSTESDSGNEKGEKADGGDQGDEQEGQEGKDGKQQSAQNGKQGQNEGSQGVMDKMRDALSNLMAKMRSQSKSDKESQGAQEGSAQQDRQQQASNKGMQGQNRSQAEGQQSADQRTDQGGEGGEKMDGQSKSSEKGSDKQSNQEGKSGVGKTDGAKELKEAEQLAAMGKISELIGKRAQQITGEMTVEVPSGKQQLRTAYTGKKAAHENAGSEVHRDEIPLDYQAYVQRYFEEIRKTPSAKKEPAKLAR